MSTHRITQAIAITDVNFRLKDKLHTITVKFLDGYNIDALLEKLCPGDTSDQSWLSLHFESLQSHELLPVIDIYLNVDPGKTPTDTNFVGSMALYGIRESSRASGIQQGSGQDWRFEVDRVFCTAFKQPNWSNKQFELSLVPYNSRPANATLMIGRIVLYLHES